MSTRDHVWTIVDRPYGYRFSLSLDLRFAPSDFWVGLYWRRNHWATPSDGWDAGRPTGDHYTVPWSFHAHLCLLPMLPLHLFVSRKVAL